MYRPTHLRQTDSPFDNSLEVLGQVTSIDNFREPFLDSRYAQLLIMSPPRFETFAWDDVDKFRHLFGDDIDPMQHGPYQARTVAIPLVEMQLEIGDDDQSQNLSMSIDEAHSFVAYHVSHDDHEGLVGDTPLPEKTVKSEDDDFLIWADMFNEIYQPQDTDEFVALARKFAVKNFDQRLGLLWDVSERIGYVSTALQAYRLATNSSGLTDHERNSAMIMAQNVSGGSLAIIEDARASIPYADKFISDCQPAISGICRALEISLEDLIRMRHDVR